MGGGRLVKKPRILLADDDRAAKATVVAIEHVFDAEVYLVAHPDYALGALTGEEKFLAVVLDGTFPGAMSGPELVDTFRMMSGPHLVNHATPICFLSGDEPEVLGARAEGGVLQGPYFKKQSPAEWRRLVAWLEEQGVPKRTREETPVAKTGT